MAVAQFGPPHTFMLDDASQPVTILAFRDLSADTLRLLSPRVVLSRLITRSFDCIDLGQKLFDFGYRGCYRILAQNLPDPSIVLNEMQVLFPGLHVQIGALDRAPHLELVTARENSLFKSSRSSHPTEMRKKPSLRPIAARREAGSAR